jgi:hypothetical protein
MALRLLRPSARVNSNHVMAHNPAAFGLYPSTKALHHGAEALRAAKFRQTDISVMYSDGKQALRLRESIPREREIADDEPPSLATLSSIGAVVMSKDGPFMAGGPILATLVHEGESLLSSLRGLGLSEDDIASFERRLKAGGLLLSVQCEDTEWAARACAIFEETGAERVATA